MVISTDAEKAFDKIQHTFMKVIEITAVTDPLPQSHAIHCLIKYKVMLSNVVPCCHFVHFQNLPSFSPLQAISTYHIILTKKLFCKLFVSLTFSFFRSQIRSHSLNRGLIAYNSKSGAPNHFLSKHPFIVYFLAAITL